VSEPPPLPQPSRKRILPAFLLCFLVCAHRFYVGKILSGLVQFALVAGSFIWTMKACGGLLAIVGSGPVTLETVERISDWEQTHGVPLAPMLALVVVGIWIAVDAGLLVAGKFTDKEGRRITRWI
jgi:hypothetical protein